MKGPKLHWSNTTIPIEPDLDISGDEVEIEKEEDVVQPWDDNDVVTPLPPINDNDNEKELREQIIEPESKGNKRNRDSLGNNKLEETYSRKIQVRLPPKIRTTKQRPTTSEPTYKEVIKFTSYKEDRHGIPYVKVFL